jgi:excinuclease ABC subunit C
VEKLISKKKKVPDAPGVYFFMGKRKEVLYIGRATSLARRVPSYFDARIKEKRSALIEKMVSEAISVEWIQTDSVLEAIIVEVNLIRANKPRYNIISRDDKSYNHVVITDEEFPRVLVLRGKDLRDKKFNWAVRDVYGPFPSGRLLRDALKIIQKIFQFYDIKTPLGSRMSKMARGTIDFNRQIGLYPNAVSKEEYQKTVRHLKLFFEGKKEKIIEELEKEMHRHAKKQEFEEAHMLKRKILALQHIQDVSLMKDDLRTYRDDRNIRIEAYDIAHMGGKDMVGVMTVMENDVVDPSSYRKFIIRGFQAANDPGALREVLTRRFGHPEWKYPDLIVVDGNSIQKNVAERVVKDLKLFSSVVAVVKDERHRPKRMLGPAKWVEDHAGAILEANAEAHRFAIAFHRKKRSIIK